MTVHGDTRIDNYFWLRDRKDPDTIAYLEAENAYTKEKMQPTEASAGHALCRDARPHSANRFERAGEARRILLLHAHRGREAVRHSLPQKGPGPEEILLDCNHLAEGHKYFRLGAFIASPNHRLLAYSVDFEGDEKYTIRVKNLDTGELLADEIPNTSYTLEWAADNATFFYTTLDEALRPYKVFRHTLGVKDDPLIYHEPDERFTLDLSSTRSRAYIFININSSLTSEVRYLREDQPSGDFQVLLPRVLVPNTTRPITATLSSSAPTTAPRLSAWWKRRWPIREGQLEGSHAGARWLTVESVTAFRDYLVTEERDRGLKQIWIHEFRTGAQHSIEFPEPVYTADWAPTPSSTPSFCVSTTLRW